MFLKHICSRFLGTFSFSVKEGGEKFQTRRRQILHGLPINNEAIQNCMGCMCEQYSDISDLRPLRQRKHLQINPSLLIIHKICSPPPTYYNRKWNCPLHLPDIIMLHLNNIISDFLSITQPEQPF